MTIDVDTSSLPQRVGGHEVVGRVARGGMAEILVGRRDGPAGFERPIIIKRILPNLADQKSFIEMFLDEARIAAGIHHPNVVHVEELGQDGDDYFIVMEYLEGETAATVIRRLAAHDRALPPGLAAHIGAEVAAGLHAAHELRTADGLAQNVVHRDLSLANVFITYDGHVKILDFGIAKAAERITRTEAGQLKGTFSFMSPEQARGEILDRRSDLFSLGIVLYEMSTQRHLFRRPMRTATLRAVVEEEVVPPTRLVSDYPSSLERVVLKALTRPREGRYQTAQEMRRDLLSVVSELSRGDPPEEALSALMCTHFADRIEEKQEMLRRFRGGATLSSVPAPAPRAQLAELPSVGPTIVDRPPRAPAKRRTSVALVLTLGLVATSTALWLLWPFDESRSATDDEVARPPTAASSITDETVDQQVPTPRADPRNTESVIIRVRTTPDGAGVHVGGEERGTTPVDLLLPRSSEGIRVRVSRSGYRSQERIIRPDVDQELHLALRLSRSTRHRPRAPRREPAAMEVAVDPTPMTMEPSEPAAASMNRFERFN